MTVFPFLVGCGRSGTTLLRSMFTFHPEVAIPYESYFVVSMGRPAHRVWYETEEGFALETFLGDLFRQFGFRHWNLPEREVRQTLTESPPGSYAGAVRQVFALYARRQGKRRYGDKTANYVLDVPLLAELFPEARFVHLIRDGRDVALSWLDTGWEFGPQTVEEAALYWRYYVQRGRRAGAQIGGERYRELRYEDLIDHPGDALRDLCAFLELDYDPAMLSYFEGAGKVLQAMPRPEWHVNLRLPVTRGLRDWKQQMPRRELALFERLAGEVLEELGYESSSGLVS